MTDLYLGDVSMDDLVAWYSLIHVPDDEIGGSSCTFGEC